MSIRYCELCQRKVDAQRKIGAGTFIMIFLTGFIWLFVVLAYPKVCPICSTTRLTNIDPPKYPILHRYARRAAAVIWWTISGIIGVSFIFAVAMMIYAAYK